MPLAEVKTLRDHSLANIPQMMRILADKIEAGLYGEVASVVCVMQGESIQTFGWGSDTTASVAHLLLALGQRNLEQQVTTQVPFGGAA